MAESGGGGAMQPGGSPARLQGIQPLAEAGERDAGQHVARAGRGQASRRVGVDEGTSIGRRHDRVAALEQNRAPAKGGGSPGAGELVSGDAREKPGEFAL